MWEDTSLASEFPHLGLLCHALPKVDLHQHLTGSLPNAAVRRVLETLGPVAARDASPEFDNNDASLQSAWDLLDRQCAEVHRATADPAHLEALFAAAIESWARENVLYCEIRVGLKHRPTKRAHLASLERVIQGQKARFPNTTVRLLLSINRAADVLSGEENVDIAIEAHGRHPEPVVCGVEFGGVATCGAWIDFEPMFRKARQAGLRIALHCGEGKEKQQEWAQMLQFAPDRLGHCVHLSDGNMQRLIALGIPVETALTCHQLHFGVKIEQNIFRRLFGREQVVLCTDNPSFYETSLSKEYQLCCQHHGLTLAQLFALARRAISFTFQPASSRARILAEF